jgi:hypothetical protein
VGILQLGNQLFFRNKLLFLSSICPHDGRPMQSGNKQNRVTIIKDVELEKRGQVFFLVLFVITICVESQNRVKTSEKHAASGILKVYRTTKPENTFIGL